ncbi:hypothetical protein [Petrocella sp. FN5]|uniref:hypothetical protein n=1 Tax=Petrocella sp. FN5 TaxID=3032002 RepID=UPI0023D9C5A1|nr:hypothetical protein [Petrocella sp. FN5]MDF1616774.1 hypothetical protein [Petrocella sp. FN5]
MRQNISIDKSWVVVILLFFIFPPLGFIAIIAKVIYMILQSQNNKDLGFSKDFKEERKFVPKPRQDGLVMPEKKTFAGDTGNHVDVRLDAPVDFLNEQKNEVSNTGSKKARSEDQLNTPPDLTIEKVHIDTIVSVEELEKKLHMEHTESEHTQPIKMITCTMCGTENPIYKIDVFETPNCKKCGMLLLDRS